MQKLVSDVLTAWRSAERLAADLSPDHPARAAVLAAVEQLQGTFNDLTMASGEREEQPGGRIEPVGAVREISQDIAADARRLHSIESQKSRISAGKRLVDLSHEARELSIDIATKAEAELEAAEEAVS
jgi:hypothetical protein